MRCLSVPIKGQASISATVALQNWSYLPASPIAVNLSVQRMSLADLQRLANVHYPVSGDLSVDIAVHGTQLNPIGKGSAKVVNAHAYDEPIQHLAADFHADKSSLTSTFELNLPAGSAKGTHFLHATNQSVYRATECSVDRVAKVADGAGQESWSRRHGDDLCQRRRDTG